MKAFQENITQEENGRYTVRLPFKENGRVLPDNSDLSIKRLQSLIHRLKKEPEIINEYQQVISQQLQDGVMEEVDMSPEPEPGTVFYMPHQAVIGRDTISTKLRIVYDASAKSSSELPRLNNSIHPGPSLIPAIMDILIRFRAYKYGITADIEKALFQVSMRENQRDFTRFLWFRDPTVDFDELELIVL